MLTCVGVGVGVCMGGCHSAAVWVDVATQAVVVGVHSLEQLREFIRDFAWPEGA